MSVAAIARAARTTLRTTLFGSTCTRYDAATDWTAGVAFGCHYEEASPQTTGLTNFEGGSSGYGVNVYLDVDAPLNPADRITVDGLTLEVQRVAVRGELDGSKRAFCVRR